MRKLCRLLFLYSLLISVVQIRLNAQEFKRLASGIDIAEIRYPFSIYCGDSLITLLRVHRDSCQIRLASASALGRKAITAEDWAVQEGFDLVFNAGMYLPGSLKSKGEMKLNTGWNQRNSLISFGGVFCVEGSKRRRFALLDKTSQGWEEERQDFAAYFENMRLLDFKGNPLDWTKKKQRCSMLVAAQDSAGNLMLAFCRSPLFHSEMVEFLQRLPLGLHTALYLEGGPETSVFLGLPDGRNLKWIGTYVSETWERNDNHEFRKLPNVVGIKFSP